MTKSRGIRIRRGTRALFVEANQGLYICQCGCGQPIDLQPVHFNVGVPLYRHGHNPQPKKQRPPRMPCECGCGSLATAGRRFISGHNRVGHKVSDTTKKAISEAHRGERSHRYGVRPPNYKGGWISRDGYRVTYSQRHPFASNGKIFQHRLVVEEHLRSTAPDTPYLVEVEGVLYLRPGLEVHHVNGVKDDNRLENLEVMTKAEHARHHHALKR